MSRPRLLPLRLPALLCPLALATLSASEAPDAAHAPTPTLPAGEERAPAPAHADAHAGPPSPEPRSATPPAPSAGTHDQRGEEYAGLMRIAEKKLSGKDAEAAIFAAREALKLARGEEAAPAQLSLARAYRVAGDGVKAVATYEHLLDEFPDWSGAPIALLELGRALRELGAPRLAIARFYSVIQSTLRLPEAETEQYRRLVRTAQFEIAETHFQTGNSPEAIRFFRRLDALDLAPADRARARFRTAQAQLLSGDRPGAVLTLDRMLARDGEAAEAAEARFTLAKIHAEEGRRDEALRVTLELLRTTSAEADAASWREWQRRAGNFLARRFKEEGEIHSALLLYRALALLDPAPSWRAPALYEVGLCLEQLQQAREARAVYAELVALIEESPDPGALAAELSRMAKWRGEQLEWAGRAEAEIRRLSPVTGTPSLEAAPNS